MKLAAPRPLWTFASVALAAILSACGGGGDSTTASASTSTTITGHAIKGPVSGATITAYSLAGGAAGAQLGQGTTAGDGSYSMTVPMTSGPMMLRVTGGTYIDESTGSPTTMSSTQGMTAVLSAVTGGMGEVQITPLTSMAQTMAAGMPGGMSGANIDAANTAVGGYFMVPDILHTMPMNPLSAGASATASQAMLNYGMTLAAMSQYAKDDGIASSVMVGAMMADASDGVLDGKSGSVPISMGGMMNGGMMQASAGTSGLSGAMLEFMNSSSNRAGVTQAMAAALMQHLSTASGAMH